MAKTKQDFVMYSGNTKYVYFNVSSLGDVDLSTAIIEWVMTKGKRVIVRKSSEDVYTDEPSIMVTNTDVFRVYIRPSDTVDIFGQYEHEAKLIVPEAPLEDREVTVATGVVKIVDSLVKKEEEEEEE